MTIAVIREAKPLVRNGWGAEIPTTRGDGIAAPILNSCVGHCDVSQREKTCYRAAVAERSLGPCTA
jgi:hypothetical protein